MSHIQPTYPRYTQRMIHLLGIEHDQYNTEQVNDGKNDIDVDCGLSFEERAAKGKILFEKLLRDAINTVENRTSVDEKLDNLRTHLYQHTTKKPGYRMFVDTAVTYARGFVEHGLDLFDKINAMGVSLSSQFPSGRRVSIMSYDSLHDTIRADRPPSNVYEDVAQRLKGKPAIVRNYGVHPADKQLVARILEQ